MVFITLFMSEELREAYELKELYKKWQNESKDEKDCTVEEKQNPAFIAIKTFKNWQVEDIQMDF